MKLIAYIGDLKDSNFNWEDGNWNGNIPKRSSPEIWFGHDVRRVMMEQIKDGKLVGKGTDWGSYVAKVTKKDVVEILDIIDADKEGILKHFKENPNDGFRRYLDTIKEDIQYALVSAEI